MVPRRLSGPCSCSLERLKGHGGNSGGGGSVFFGAEERILLGALKAPTPASDPGDQAWPRPPAGHLPAAPSTTSRWHPHPVILPQFPSFTGGSKVPERGQGDTDGVGPGSSGTHRHAHTCAHA